MRLPLSTALRTNNPKRAVNVIHGGGNFNMALQRNGKLWAWGSNQSGQVGDNSLIAKCTPTAIAGAAKTFCEISTGGANAAAAHALAIDKYGRVWAWGANTTGQIGDNSTVSKLTPVSVLGSAKTFCRIDSGNVHSLAIDKNGRVWSWGGNVFGRFPGGQLGDGTINSRLTPVSVIGQVKTFCRIAAGDAFSLAIDKNGKPWAWGFARGGKLGDNLSGDKCTPVAVCTDKTFCLISAYPHSLAIDKNGQAWAWGVNLYGQLGDNSTISKNIPVSVAGLPKTFCQISAGSNHSLAIDKNGKIWAWGNNTCGELGDGTTNSKITPVAVIGQPRTFCKINSGLFLSLAIDKHGGAWAWGFNDNGELGIGSTISSLTPVRICNI
jgi:alpha-tubulin suppressor-like RCC1 family protein